MLSDVTFRIPAHERPKHLRGIGAPLPHGPEEITYIDPPDNDISYD